MIALQILAVVVITSVLVLTVLGLCGPTCRRHRRRAADAIAATSAPTAGGAAAQSG